MSKPTKTWEFRRIRRRHLLLQALRELAAKATFRGRW